MIRSPSPYRPGPSPEPRYREEEEWPYARDDDWAEPPPWRGKGRFDGKGKGKSRGKDWFDGPQADFRWTGSGGGRGGYNGHAEPDRWWQGGRGKGAGKGEKGGYRAGGSGFQVSSTRVHVSNLPPDSSEGSVTDLFAKHGHVLGLQLLAGARGGPNGRACAIVRFQSNAGAVASIAALHNKYEAHPGDGPLIVKLAKPNPRWDS